MLAKTRAICLLVVALWLTPTVPEARADDPAATALDGAHDRLVKRVKDAGGTVGIAVMALDADEPLLTYQAGAPLEPASNMKLFTAWAALRALGPDHEYLTALYGDQAGERVDTLLLRGEGDPSLEMRHLREMVARLHRAAARLRDAQP